MQSVPPRIRSLSATSGSRLGAPARERGAPIMSGSEGQTASMQERWRAL